MILEMEQVCFEVGDGPDRLRILDETSFTVAENESLAVVGRSGSGKSSLLSILGLMQRPTRGVYRLAGEDVRAMSETARSRARSSVVGFVFQGYSLVPQLTAEQNVMLPFTYGPRVPTARARRRAHDLLEVVGLQDHRGKKPRQLSGGEQQRVAIARSLVRQPRVLLADEPTGALDVSTGEQVMSVLLDAVREQGTSLVLVTHDLENAELMDRTLLLDAGRLQEVGAS